MNRDEWNEELVARPVTPNQRGAIMREFARLGVSDRAERLAASAALLSLAELRTTAELVMGQAGQLVNTLARIRDADELADLAEEHIAAAAGARPDDDPTDLGDDQDDEHASAVRTTWLEAISRIVIAINSVLPENAL